MPESSGADPAAMLLQMVEACVSPLVLLDLSGRVVRANASCAQLAGRPAAKMVGRPVWEVLPAVEGERATRRHWAGLPHGAAPPPVEQVSVDDIGNRRRIHWTYVSVPATEETPGFIVGTGQDVTRERIAEAVWRQRAETDVLTGLANRAVFQECIAEHSDALTGLGCGVLFCDLDGFKAVNDAFGHATGDQVLRQVAARLLDSVRGGDLVARFGGDEFAVLLPAVGALEMRALAARLERSIRRPLRLPVGPVTIGVSVGLAVLAPGDDPDAAMRSADAAMYAVKAGRVARSNRG